MQLPYSIYEQYNNYSGNGQSALLQAVKTSIEKTYSKTSIRGDGQVILVPFTDGITFEVVPAFNNKDDSYTYPNANNGGRWQTTNPKPEISAIRTRNSNCNGNLVSLCRMMRAWKRKWDVPIGGLLVDTLAYQFIEDWQYKTSRTSTTTICAEISSDSWPTKTRRRSIGKPLVAASMSMAKAFFSGKRQDVTTLHSKQLNTKPPNPSGNGLRSRNGGRSLEPHSQTDDTPDSRLFLRASCGVFRARCVHTQDA